MENSTKSIILFDSCVNTPKLHWWYFQFCKRQQYRRINLFKSCFLNIFPFIKVQLPPGLSGILNQTQFNFTLSNANLTKNISASIQIQANLLSTSINSILEQSTRLGNLSSNSAVYTKQSVNLNANQSASSNLVSWLIYCLKKSFHL